jgi:hypothetical protein
MAGSQGWCSEWNLLIFAHMRLILIQSQIYGGGPLRPAVGDALAAAGVNVLSMYGA